MDTSGCSNFSRGYFTVDDIAKLTVGLPHVRFELFQARYWCLPDFWDPNDRTSWHNQGYSIGYRHMIGWYSKNIFQYALEAAYKWGDALRRRIFHLDTSQSQGQ